MTRASAVVTTAAALWLAGFAGPAEGQSTFLDAVRELAGTATVATAARTDLTPHRTAALARFKAALEEWDRSIAATEGRIARLLRDAPDERTFQLRIELALAYGQRG